MGASKVEGASVKTLAPPLLKNNKIISCKGLFPLFMGAFFFMGGGGPFFFLCENFFRLVDGPIYKTFCGAHGFATRVVPNMSFSQELY